MTITTSRAISLLGALIGVLALAACSLAGASPSPSSQPPPLATLTAAPAEATAAPTSRTSVSPSRSPVGSSPGITPAAPPSPTATPAVVIDAPWALAPLTDVTTAESFRIADIVASGKVAFVEPMAIWCTSCRAQQAAAVEAFQTLGPDIAEWVGVDVETTETADALARYREQHGFPFRYAISDNALSRSLVDDFGEVVLSPPSVNVIIVGTDGQVAHMLGHNSAAELVALAMEYAR